MEVLPERLAVRKRGRIHAFALAGRPQHIAQLLGERGRVAADVEAHVDGKEVLLAQAWEQAGLQERSLAEPRLAEEHGERCAGHSSDEVLGLGVATVEIVARVFFEGLEPRPGVVRVELAFDRRGRERLVHRASRRRAARTTRSASDEVSRPSGAPTKLKSRNMRYATS